MTPTSTPKILFCAALLCCAVAADAADRRIRTVAFSDSTVLRLAGCPNFQTTVRFGAGEQIENVGIGDAAQWQVVPNRRADLLFVKPLTTHGRTNMTVVTDRHTYDFELTAASPIACHRGDVVYDLRFAYADPSSSAAPAPAADPDSLLPLPEKRNAAYTYSGDADLVPVRVFDDGKSTYLKWSEGVAVPAIYAVAADQTETMVNYANRGDYLVVELVAKAFALRQGAHAAILYNEAFATPPRDAQSPQPAPPPKRERSLWPF